MSFEDFNKDELAKIAEEFVLDVEDAGDEDELRAAVETLSPEEVALSFPEFADRLEVDDDEDGDEATGLVTSDNTTKKGVPAKKAAAKKATAKKAAAKPAAKTVVPEEKTLLKMTRNNPVYEVRGYRFTRAVPYAYVNDADVDFLIEVEGGFTVAKPSEVKSFFE